MVYINLLKALYVILIKQTLCVHKNKTELGMVESECCFDKGTYYRNLILKCNDCGKIIDVEHMSTFERKLVQKITNYKQ